MWHLRRIGGPPVTAVLRQTVNSVALDVWFGDVARQTRMFPTALLASQYAEALRDHLERCGCNPSRRDRRQHDRRRPDGRGSPSSLA